jgi:hypothetical protein
MNWIRGRRKTKRIGIKGGNEKRRQQEMKRGVSERRKELKEVK